MKQIIAWLGVVFLAIPLVIASAIVMSPLWIPFAILHFVDWSIGTVTDTALEDGK